MAADEIRVGDVGTVLEVTVLDDGTPVDLSSVTTKDFIFRKPKGTKVTVSSSFSTDGTDGKLRYTTVADDLDTPGVWKLQAYLVFPSSGEWRSDLAQFTVHRNL